MIKRLGIWIAKIGLVCIALFLSLITAINYSVFGHIQTEEELKEYKNHQASVVVAQGQEVLGKFYQENRTNVTYNQLPEHLIHALIATEDVRFFEHSGVDSKSLLRVLFKTLLLNNKRSGGGSTITQQLAKNRYGRKDFGPLTLPINKIKEAILAYRVERVFSKKEILTLYLNTVSFGENVYGIEAAALRYFNKPVSQLLTEESAVLVGILKANTFYNPRLHPKHAEKRRNVVLKQMEKYQYLSQVVSDSLQQLPLQLDYSNLDNQYSTGYFLTQVKKEAEQILAQLDTSENYSLETDGLIIKTTIDYHFHKTAYKALKKQLTQKQQQVHQLYKTPKYSTALQQHTSNILKKKDLYASKFDTKKRLIFDWNKNYTDSISVKDSIALAELQLHSGVLAINPKTGAIKTWIGGINYNFFPFDQVHAQKQLASTFKPILYAAALEGGISPCQHLSNDPIKLSDYNDWNPQNSNATTGGKYSMAGALKNSLNIPSVNLFIKTDFSSITQLWDNLKFSQPLDPKPASALGTTTASVFELTRAYSAFANNGKTVNPYFISEITTQNGTVIYQKENLTNEPVVLSETSVKLINTMLQKAVDEGTGKSIRSHYQIKLPLAGKTGSSQNFADAWFVAYNPNIVITSRVGFNSPAIHTNGTIGSGGQLALPIIAETLRENQANLIADFQSLTTEELELLDCPDFKEKNTLEKLFGIFKKKEKSYSREQQKIKKKKRRKK